MEITNTYFECEIENLHYITIEREITKYFGMGCPNSSSFSPLVSEDYSDECTIIGTIKSGTFDVRIDKLKNGKYLLSVWLIGRLHNI